MYGLREYFMSAAKLGRCQPITFVGVRMDHRYEIYFFFFNANVKHRGSFTYCIFLNEFEFEQELLHFAKTKTKAKARSVKII